MKLNEIAGLGLIAFIIFLIYKMGKDLGSWFTEAGKGIGEWMHKTREGIQKGFGEIQKGLGKWGHEVQKGISKGVEEVKRGAIKELSKPIVIISPKEEKRMTPSEKFGREFTKHFVKPWPIGAVESVAEFFWKLGLQLPKPLPEKEMMKKIKPKKVDTKPVKKEGLPEQIIKGAAQILKPWPIGAIESVAGMVRKIFK